MHAVIMIPKKQSTGIIHQNNRTDTTILGDKSLLNNSPLKTNASSKRQHSSY